MLCPAPRFVVRIFADDAGGATMAVNGYTPTVIAAQVKFVAGPINSLSIGV